MNQRACGMRRGPALYDVEMAKQSITVMIDDAKYGAGPGTIVAAGETLDEYRGRCERDGVLNQRLRFWSDSTGYAKVGDRVRLSPQE